MTWQIGSFTILVLVLALVGGFAWYERGRPDSRVLALVATLTALAALGRIAFATLPNVKPTTDIVLIAGFALGGGPGFVVGALAGLTSNFFFGQGPWTPWQMAAWGVTGLIGALLARATVRRGRPLGRWPLALVCAACGFAFTTVQDFSDWVTYSDHSLAQLDVLLARGIAFDFIHAGGCLLFALAFGPALARSIARFTARLQVVWRDEPLLPPATLACALVLGAAALGAGLAAPTPAGATGTPAGYLLGAQNTDGGFGPAPGSASNELYSGWAALGLASAGNSPGALSHGGATLLAYVQGAARSPSDAGSLERTILVSAAAGAPLRDSAGRDLLAELQHSLGPDGSVSDQVNLTAFAVLALRAAGAPVSARTLGWLAAQQNGDGGFSFAAGGAGGSDVDDTGAVLEALGGRAPRAGRAVRFIRAQQNSDGGLPAQPGAESNAQSTAWAVQGLLAAGVDPDAVHQGRSPSPLDYLRRLVAADGHVRYSSSRDQTPVWVTGEALMALERRPLPLAPLGAGSGGSGRTGPAAAVRHRSPTHHIAHRRGRRGRQGAVAGGESPALDRLAAGAGVVAALAFAAVGVS